MGCSYSAYTVIGCVLDRDKLYHQVEVTDIEHACAGFKKYVTKLEEFPAKCPDCGAAIKNKETKPRNKNGEKFIEEWTENWDTGNLTEPRIVSDGMNGNEWIGLFVEEFGDDSGGGKSYLSTINVNEHKKSLKKLLQPLGLWDEGSFGIHTILYISC